MWLHAFAKVVDPHLPVFNMNTFMVKPRAGHDTQM
jgi:hypothetical protein